RPGRVVEADPVLPGCGRDARGGHPPVHLRDGRIVGDVHLRQVDGPVDGHGSGGRDDRVVGPCGEPVVDGQLLPERSGGRVHGSGGGDGEQVGAAVAERQEPPGGAAVGGGDEDALRGRACRRTAAEVDGQGGGAGGVAGEGAAVGVGDLHGAAGQRLVPRDVHRGRLAVVADEVEGGCYVDAGGGRLVDRDGVFGRRGRLQECGPHSQVGGDASGEGAAALG